MPFYPKIIQGGMGIGVSSWRLALAVSSLGQLGVVSGALLDVVVARQLQDGDLDGHVRRALDQFPDHRIADSVRERYFIPGGRRTAQPCRPLPMHSTEDAHQQVELCIAANFVEVYLAREGHPGPVGINYLEKIQLPHLPSLYGAMLAGVSYVLMGAGIPYRIPGVLDGLADHRAVEYPIRVAGSEEGSGVILRFDPKRHVGPGLPPLRRPLFLPIIASDVLAKALLKRSVGHIDGFVIEGPSAGGHHAPPRRGLKLSAAGEPVYGERDRVDFGIAVLGRGRVCLAPEAAGGLEPGRDGHSGGNGFRTLRRVWNPRGIQAASTATGEGRYGPRVYRSGGIPDWIPVQGGAIGRHRV